MTVKEAELPLTPREVATRLRVGLSTVYDLLNSGKLRHVRIGRVYRIPPAALAEFLAGATVGPEKPAPAPAPRPSRRRPGLVIPDVFGDLA